MNFNLVNTYFQKKALEVSFVLHQQLLTDCNYEGYDGDKDAFDNLYKEVYAIARYELPDDADNEQIVTVFHEYQLEQMNGEREIGWYL
jgi:hypothetical protein